MLHKPAPPSPSRCAHATTTIRSLLSLSPSSSKLSNSALLLIIIVAILQYHNVSFAYSHEDFFISVIVTIMMKVLLKNVLKNTISNYCSHLLGISRLNNEIQLVKTENIGENILSGSVLYISFLIFFCLPLCLIC